MSFDRNAVQEAVNAVIRANGSAFVEPSRVRTGTELRTACLALLVRFGVTLEDGGKATGDELAALYAATRKDAVTGSRVADRIKRKYAHNPLFDPPAQTPVAPSVPETPVELTAPPSVDMATALETMQEILKRERSATLNHLEQLTDQARAEMRHQVADAVDAMEARIAETVDAAIKARTPTELIVTVPNAAPVIIGLAHHMTGKLIQALAAGENVYLHGPAGSGKTTAAQMAAKALSLQFYFAAKVESEYLLLGFKDARGETVRTQFREAYEHGGLFLFDELDGSSPQAVVALNAALANGVCPFPDGTIAKHADFKCIGAGNTTLSGASRQYVGRNQLDAASVDRFAFLEWGYDDQLEMELATDKNWCRFVQATRKTVQDRALNHLVTPRATLSGCRLLASGFAWDEVASMVVYKGLDNDTVTQIKNATRYATPTSQAMAA